MATAAIRGAHKILGQEHAAWLLLVADDLAGKISETILLVLVFFPSLLGKLARGETLQRVGYELVLTEASLGLSASRAQWLEGWYSRLLRDRSVQMQELQEGFGSGCLCLRCARLRPALPGTAVRPTLRAGHRGVPATQEPPAMSLQVRQVAHQLERGLEGRRSRRRERSGSRRLVATSEQEETRIKPWFAIKVTPENAPWALQREGKAYRVIASLEALGLLLALLASGPAPRAERHEDGHPSLRIHGQPRERIRHQHFLLRAIVMELAAQA